MVNDWWPLKLLVATNLSGLNTYPAMCCLWSVGNAKKRNHTTVYFEMIPFIPNSDYVLTVCQIKELHSAPMEEDCFLTWSDNCIYEQKHVMLYYVDCSQFKCKIMYILLLLLISRYLEKRKLHQHLGNFGLIVTSCKTNCRQNIWKTGKEFNELSIFVTFYLETRQYRSTNIPVIEVFLASLSFQELKS